MASFDISSPEVELAISMASEREKEQFRALWDQHLDMFREGKIMYFIPQNLGFRMGLDAMIGIARRLSDELGENTFVHLDQVTQTFVISPYDIEGPTTQMALGWDSNLNAPIPRQTYRKETVPDSSASPTSQAPESQTLLTSPHHKSNNGSAPPQFRDQHEDVDEATIKSARIGNKIKDQILKPQIPAKVSKIPKPRNAWIFYRQEKHAEVLAANPGMHTSMISKHISAMWRSSKKPDLDRYYKLADEEKVKYRLRYPDYKCSPRKSSEIKKRKTASKGMKEIVATPSSTNDVLASRN